MVRKVQRIRAWGKVILCEESMELEIVNNKKKTPARSLFFIEMRTRNMSFFFTWPKREVKG